MVIARSADSTHRTTGAFLHMCATNKAQARARYTLITMFGSWNYANKQLAQRTLSHVSHCWYAVAQQRLPYQRRPTKRSARIIWEAARRWWAPERLQSGQYITARSSYTHRICDTHCVIIIIQKYDRN